MTIRAQHAELLLAAGLIVLSYSVASAIEPWHSHPPQRPLPQAVQRPMSDGPARFVDPRMGDDGHDGSQAAPWRSLNFAVAKLTPGTTLYLRAGIYYEHVRCSVRGEPDRPITIRSFPGELAVIDGGLPEFVADPIAAWEPVSDGADHEFRSVRIYPGLGERDGETHLLGNFGDSLVPLHGYRYLSDLRSSNEYFAALGAGKTDAGNGVYCGPGLYYDVTSRRIHVRLAHTHQRALGADNYRGETDPRRIPLIIAAANQGPPLNILNSRHLRIADLVVRGARSATIEVADSLDIAFHGVTAYGGSAPFRVVDTHGLLLMDCACRGIAAPWTYRGSLKYRAIEARLFSASGWAPTGNDNRDFELAHSEFTDCVDGVFIGNVNSVRFHHNLLDNISDDGIFLTATTGYDGVTPGGNVHVFQNRLSRCLTTFAFGVGHGRQRVIPSGRQAGSGVFIYRNLFDLRQPVMYQQPAEGEAEITSYGRVAGDHGGPLWEPMMVYHNTILLAEAPWRGYYLAGFGSHMAGGSKRQLFNNMVVQATGLPGTVLPKVVSRDAPQPVDFATDGNLHWSVAAQPGKEILSRFRNSTEFTASRQWYPPGWIAHDMVADPRIASFQADWRDTCEASLTADSPAIDAGVPLPNDWPDPLSEDDAGLPDIGALPAGAMVWRVAARGRMTLFGVRAAPASTSDRLLVQSLSERSPSANAVESARRLVAIVQGYPAFDAPLIEYALRRRGVMLASMQRTWLDTNEYERFAAVVIVGDLTRAGIQPDKYSAEDLVRVRQFLDEGGTLLLMRGNKRVFSTPAGKEFLEELVGFNAATAAPFRILRPAHPWLRHLDTRKPLDWLNVRHAEPLRVTKGESIIGSGNGLATLYRIAVGRGQLIYVGWEIAASLPKGRQPSTVEDEAIYQQQYAVLDNLVEFLSRRKLLKQ